MSNNKRLERDLSNRVLGGVCSGLGNYFGIDPIFWRILFIILCFIPAIPGLLTYIILWIVMPECKRQAPTAAGPNPQYNDVDGSVQSEQPSQSTQPAQPGRSDGRWLAGLILIGIGAMWLLMRYIPQITWQTVWPVILIVLGVFFLIPIKNKKS